MPFLKMRLSRFVVGLSLRPVGVLLSTMLPARGYQGSFAGSLSPIGALVGRIGRTRGGGVIPGIHTTASSAVTSGHSSRSRAGTFASVNRSWTFAPRGPFIRSPGRRPRTMTRSASMCASCAVPSRSASSAKRHPCQSAVWPRSSVTAPFLNNFLSGGAIPSSRAAMRSVAYSRSARPPGRSSESRAVRRCRELRQRGAVTRGELLAGAALPPEHQCVRAGVAVARKPLERDGLWSFGLLARTASSIDAAWSAEMSATAAAASARRAIALVISGLSFASSGEDAMADAVAREAQGTVRRVLSAA